MPLDKRRQAQLDIFCGCCGVLLEHLDALDYAAQSHLEWSAYKIVKGCFNPAVKEFGSAEVKALDLAALSSDFLSRAEGFIVGKLGSDSPVLEAFSQYRAAAQASPVPTQEDLTSWQRLGEELSIECYREVLRADSSNLTRAVKPICIEPSKKQDVRCIPQKDGGESEITFYFAPPEFTFESYVNLPLYFFHEYLSHIHTAPLFGELDENPAPFEDGWLLYLARIIYRHRLLRDPHPCLTHHLHREHYAESYFDSLNEVDIGRPWIEFGFRQARHFESVVRADLFRAVTLLVATSPYGHFPNILDLHGEFVTRIQNWLRKTATLCMEEKETLAEELAVELKKTEPLKRLFAFLVKG